MSLVAVAVIATSLPGIGMGIAIEVLAGSQHESTYLPRALEPLTRALPLALIKARLSFPKWGAVEFNSSPRYGGARGAGRLLNNVMLLNKTTTAN